jgi:hypothetical protein
MTIIMNYPSHEHPGLQDTICIMKRQESQKYKNIEFTIPPEFKLVIDKAWREQILQWMYGVVDFCVLPRESVAAAAYFVDFSVSKGLIQSRLDYQIVAITALHLSLKVFDSSMVKLESLVKLGRGLFTVGDVVETEQILLKALNWNLHPPTSGCFLYQFLLLLPSRVSDSIRHTVTNITQCINEIAVCQNQFSRFSPSTIAFAGMLISMELLDEEQLPVSQRQCFLFQMATVAKMDSDAPELHKAMEELKPYMKENKKLMELLETIGVWSRICKLDSATDYRKLRIQETIAAESSPRQTNTALYA